MGCEVRLVSSDGPHRGAAGRPGAKAHLPAAIGFGWAQGRVERSSGFKLGFGWAWMDTTWGAGYAWATDW